MKVPLFRLAASAVLMVALSGCAYYYPGDYYYDYGGTPYDYSEPYFYAYPPTYFYYDYDDPYHYPYPSYYPYSIVPYGFSFYYSGGDRDRGGHRSGGPRRR
jgi:hypothetical protein